MHHGGTENTKRKQGMRRCFSSFSYEIFFVFSASFVSFTFPPVL